MFFDIKNRWSGQVQFSAEIDCDINAETGIKVGLAVKLAVKTGASLVGANLVGANLARASLARANLDGANLVGANLDGANLVGANLDGANLVGANLARASLDGANLARASLDGANLDNDEKLIGENPIWMAGPMGSRNAYLAVHRTDQGLRVRAGCFFGAAGGFLEAVARTHGDNRHAVNYRAAIDAARVILGSAEAGAD